jgi:mannose-6-phosphate isomerase-like protein (cupin superfamily)
LTDKRRLLYLSRIEQEGGMAGQEATLIRQADAKNFMEGVEHCREYVRDATLWFGISVVPPGQRGEVDVGHGVSEEVFFCAEGHVLVYDGQRHYELAKGDALLIPPGLPHTIINIGDVSATVVWSGAPGE